MAHNNGMVPRQRKARASSKSSGGTAEKAARYRAGVDCLGVFKLEGDAIDPAYQTVPISEFVPHRPARPEKSEGGKKFKLVSDYNPAGDQPTAIKELVAGVSAHERDQV